MHPLCSEVLQRVPLHDPAVVGHQEASVGREAESFISLHGAIFGAVLGEVSGEKLSKNLGNRKKKPYCMTQPLCAMRKQALGEKERASSAAMVLASGPCWVKYPRQKKIEEKFKKPLRKKKIEK